MSSIMNRTAVVANPAITTNPGAAAPESGSTPGGTSVTWFSAATGKGQFFSSLGSSARNFNEILSNPAPRNLSQFVWKALEDRGLGADARTEIFLKGTLSEAPLSARFKS